MFPIQAPIKSNQSGAEVVNLQEGLLFILDKQILNFAQARASDPNRANELHDQTRAEMHERLYGGTTGEVVQIFQEQNRLGVTGEVDDATAAALNRLLQEFGLFGNGGWEDVLRALEAHRQTLQEINLDTDHLINIDDKLGGLADAPTLWGIKQGTDHLSGIEAKLVGVADAQTLQV